MDNAVGVDDALGRLRNPTTVEDRLQILRQLVAYWHGAIHEEDGRSDSKLDMVQIPRVLKWWYGWAGNRTEIMSRQNFLLEPEKLRMEDDLLVFYVENQAVYRWATEPGGDDPPVFGRYRKSDPWEPEGILLSEHLILACIFEAVLRSPYGASAACLKARTLSKIQEQLAPVAIGPWQWLGPTRFYAKDGAFMYCMPNGKDLFSVWIGAKTAESLRFLEPHLGSAWEYVAM